MNLFGSLPGSEMLQKLSIASFDVRARFELSSIQTSYVPSLEVYLDPGSSCSGGYLFRWKFTWDSLVDRFKLLISLHSKFTWKLQIFSVAVLR